MAMTPESSPPSPPGLTDSFTTAASADPSKVFISLATTPILLGLVLGRSLAETIQQVGLASEEIFRGDRLPVLNVTDAAADTSNANDNTTVAND